MIIDEEVDSDNKDDSDDSDDCLLVPIEPKPPIRNQDEPHSSAGTPAKKPYACKKCNQSFNHASNLSRHKLTIHENKHSFACDQCYKIFNQMCHLKTHKSVVHDGIRSQVCQLCGKCFQNAPLLKRHLLTHTGWLPYLPRGRIPKVLKIHFFLSIFQENGHFHVNNVKKRLHKPVI